MTMARDCQGTAGLRDRDGAERASGHSMGVKIGGRGFERVSGGSRMAGDRDVLYDRPAGRLPAYRPCVDSFGSWVRICRAREDSDHLGGLFDAMSGCRLGDCAVASTAAITATPKSLNLNMKPLPAGCPFSRVSLGDTWLVSELQSVGQTPTPMAQPRLSRGP